MKRSELKQIISEVIEESIESEKQNWVKQKQKEIEKILDKMSVRYTQLYSDLLDLSDAGDFSSTQVKDMKAERKQIRIDFSLINTLYKNIAQYYDSFRNKTGQEIVDNMFSKEVVIESKDITRNDGDKFVKQQWVRQAKKDIEKCLDESDSDAESLLDKLDSDKLSMSEIKSIEKEIVELRNVIKVMTKAYSDIDTYYDNHKDKLGQELIKSILKK